MRTPRRSRAAVLSGIALAVFASGCGGSDSSTSAPGGSSTPAAKVSDVVNLAFNADMQVPDPDIFYEIEGNSVTTSVYEGLVRYKPNSTELEGALASTFTVSTDGMTYTFTLRNGVTFHDGTPLDSAAAKASFERRTSVNSAPAYMLADVDSYTTPDPSTFVVKLKTPVSAFLDYLAAPYGPKMVSPKVLKEQGGSDFAQSYLKTHDAGTGPFQMTEFIPGDHYTLTRFDRYWGTKPQLSRIQITLLPDISTQRLKLEGGELSMIIHGLSKADIASFEKNKEFQIQRFPALLKNLVFVNQNKGPFKEQAMRTALRSAIDKRQITEQVFGDNGAPSTQVYPVNEIPPGMAMDDPKLDPALLRTATASASTKKVDLAFSSDDARNQRVAELLQTQLQASGLDAQVRGIPIAQVFDLPNHADQAPDLLVATVNPDAAHPDTWIRIFQNTKGALNWLQCSVPAADAAMDAGLHTTDKAVITASYAKAADEIAAAGCFDTIADVKEVVVAKAGYGGFTHQLPTLFTIRFADLTLS